MINCEFCGKEVATKRGLAMHNSRPGPECFRQRRTKMFHNAGWLLRGYAPRESVHFVVENTAAGLTTLSESMASGVWVFSFEVREKIYSKMVRITYRAEAPQVATIDRANNAAKQDLVMRTSEMDEEAHLLMRMGPGPERDAKYEQITAEYTLLHGGVA